MIHAVKILPTFFKDVVELQKKFEVRKDDRGYKVGDFLALNEYDGTNYTGRCCIVEIEYILKDDTMLVNDHIVIGIAPCFIGGQKETYARDFITSHDIPVYATRENNKNNSETAATEPLQEIADDFCDNYCKFPEQYDDEEELIARVLRPVPFK